MGGQRLWKQSTTSVHEAVRRAVTVARDNERISAHDEPFVTLALLVAGQLDTAAADGDRAADVARLTKPLRDLLNDLPLRAVEVPDGRPVFTSDDDGDDAGDAEPAADPVDAELAELVGSGPEMGDTPES